MNIVVRYILLACGMTRLATLFLVSRHDGLSVFFAQDFPIMVIACLELPLGIVDDADVAATFTWASAATFITPIVASTRLNYENLSGKLLLWYIGYRGCEMVSHLRIYNAVKVSPDLNSLD